MRSLFGNRRGANAVEFALALPVLMIIIGTTIDYGWYFHQSVLMVQATNAGGRAASMIEAPAGTTTACDTGAQVASDAWVASGFAVGQNDFTCEDSGTMKCVSGSVDYTCLVCGWKYTMPDRLNHTVCYEYEY